MNEAIDFNTLKWLKRELDETLTQARHALEAHVGKSDDDVSLAACAQHVHQVTGTLRMVQLHGAALLAEEMEAVIQGLTDRRVVEEQAAAEILMRSLLQLPDYLERLMKGHSDVPLVLLPLLNELRAVRGESLLSENALFQPDLSRPLPADVRACHDPDCDLMTLGRAMRHQYQLALLAWYRNQDPDDALRQMFDVVDRLQSVSRFEPVSRLWWISGGLIQALRDKLLEPSMATRLLLGQVDRQIKRLLEEGEEALAVEPSLDLLKNLLFYVARAANGNPQVDQIRQVYTLDQLLPAESELEEARQSLHGHNAELMATVSAAIKEDIARVKDNLDLFVRSEGKTSADLGPAVEVLRRVADTLSMLGLGDLREAVLTRAESVLKLASGSQEVNESELIDIASGLLVVESSLDELSANGSALQNPMPFGGARAGGLVLPDAEFEHLRSVVAEEALRDLALAKDAIVGFAVEATDFDHLDNVPQLLNQIRGGLLLLSELRAAELVDSVARYLGHDLLGARVTPDRDALDHLADAISSLEYYLENLCESRVLIESVLDVADDRVGRLGYPRMASGPTGPVLSMGSDDEGMATALQPIDGAGTDFAGISKAPEDTPEWKLEDQAADDDGDRRESGDLPDSNGVCERPVGAVEALQQEEEAVESHELTSEPNIPATAKHAVDASAATTPADEPETYDAETQSGSLDYAAGNAGEGATTEEDGYPILDGEADDEILEIFLEEAEEERTNLSEHFPKWYSDPEDTDALGTMRRCWHTLKGSGRLVGAMRIGEFAWAYENLLNRIIDRTVTRTDSVCQLLAQAVEVLPKLIVEVRSGTRQANIADLMAKAEAASHGQAVPETSGEGHELDTDVEISNSPDIETLVAANSDDARPNVEDIDPVLMDIFAAETGVHLATVRAGLDSGDEEGNIPVSGELARALHTLRGSAYQANVIAIAEIGEAAEKYVKELLANQAGIEAEGREVLLDAAAAVERILGEIQSSSENWPDTSAVLERLARLPRFSKDREGKTDRRTNDTNVAAASDSPIPTGQPQIAEQLSSEESMGGEPREPEETISASEGVTAETAKSAGKIESTHQDSAELVFPQPGTVYQQIDYSGIDEELLDAFLEEGSEILASFEEGLHAWIHAPEDTGLIARLQRDLHTLKGGARMASISAIGDLSHALESALNAIIDGHFISGPELFDVLHAAQDQLVDLIDAVRHRGPLASPQGVLDRLDALRRASALDADDQVAEDTLDDALSSLSPRGTEHVAELATASTTVAGFNPPTAATAPDNEVNQIATRGPQELVRIRADLLDDMVNYAGEISIYRSRLEQQIGTYRFNLIELGQTVDRLREQLRKLEIETEAHVLFRYERDARPSAEGFDPLEMDRYSHLQQLSRSLVESISDLVSLQGLLSNTTRESETLLLQQSRVNTELQEGLMRTRMVPFSGLAPRMRRIVRQACKELGKQAELVLEGAEGEMDRAVIDRIIAPIEHMLRNALAHGIESPEERRIKGKSEVGTINVRLSREGSEVVIRIADDGAGMSLEAIRAKARDRGLLTDGVELSDNNILQFVLETGFSTAKEVTQIAGRGVGMDVVSSEVKQLGGTLHIASEEGNGAEFTIRLPFTVAITQALMAQVHEEVYAIPLATIEGIVRMNAEELQGVYRDPERRYEYAGTSYQVRSLSDMLGLGAPPAGEAPGHLPVLLVRAGDQRIALQVDALLGSRETVVKSVGPQISTVRGVSGATILGDGRVVLILDLSALLRHGAHVPLLSSRVPVDDAPREQRRATIMVVDDSITVRKVTTRLLERNDLHVITAKDGVDAVAKLQESVPDVMLLDIEMPRMDGYELATHVRNDERLRSVPIIMITSRVGEKHRNRAVEIGVDRYLGKPYQEGDLLRTIKDLLEERQVSGAYAPA